MKKRIEEEKPKLDVYLTDGKLIFEDLSNNRRYEIDVDEFLKLIESKHPKYIKGKR